MQYSINLQYAHILYTFPIHVIVTRIPYRHRIQIIIPNILTKRFLKLCVKLFNAFFGNKIQILTFYSGVILTSSALNRYCTPLLHSLQIIFCIGRDFGNQFSKKNARTNLMDLFAMSRNWRRERLVFLCFNFSSLIVLFSLVVGFIIMIS